MPIPGFDTYIVDDPASGAEATATDTLYLLSTNGPATPTLKTAPDTGNATLDAQLRLFMTLAKRSAVYVQGYGSTGLPTTIANALAELPGGPGQVVAPEAVTSADLIALAGAWGQNKVSLLQGASNATDSALTTLSAAVIVGADARGSAIFADYIALPVGVGGANVTIPQSLVVAALIARNDQLLKNPNIAPAGRRGIVPMAGTVADPKTDARRTTLRTAQVNAMKTVGGSLRNYGFRSLANLTSLPHWWAFSGARTVMAFRAQAGLIDEELVFEQIDGHGKFLGRYESALRAKAKDLYDIDALYGDTPETAYSVDVGPNVNSPDDLASGEVTAQVALKTSDFAEHLVTNITRRAHSAPV